MTEKTTEKTKNADTVRAVGRRKTASARVMLKPGSGTIVINDKPYTKYFPLKNWQDTVVSPLNAVGREKEFDVSVKVRGGGLSSQTEAVRHGIARALVKWNEDLKPILKAQEFMTRDARAKERKKYGKRKARRGRQWRKR